MPKAATWKTGARTASSAWAHAVHTGRQGAASPGRQHRAAEHHPVPAAWRRINTWLGRQIEWNPQQLHASLDVSSIANPHLLRRLAAEAGTPGSGGVLLCEFLAGQIIIELGRYFEAIGDLPFSGGLAAWRLRLIDERLREVAAPPGLSELAALCRISETAIDGAVSAPAGAVPLRYDRAEPD